MLSYIKYIRFYLILILVASCSSSDVLQNELFSEDNNITCPDVKFIEGLDILSVRDANQNSYDLKFHEVKWKCYSMISRNNNKSDNIDLFISFKVDYIEDISEYKTENFSFVVVLLDKKNKIITKNKFNRSFLSASKSQIILNDNTLISIKVKDSLDSIYNHKLLLGFLKAIKE